MIGPTGACHASLPAKSTAITPLGPRYAYTRRPSVVGVLEAWPFFRLTGCLLVSGAKVSQSFFPVARSNAAMPRLSPLADPVVMKIRFAQTIGEPLPLVSSFVFHFTFSVSDHWST